MSDDDGKSAYFRMREQSDKERAEALEMVKRCIKSLRDNPNMEDKHVWANVQTIELFWRKLPELYATEVDEMRFDPSVEDFVYRNRAEIDAERIKLEREEHERVLKEVGTTDEELQRLFRGHVWGYYPGEQPKEPCTSAQ